MKEDVNNFWGDEDKSKTNNKQTNNQESKREKQAGPLNQDVKLTLAPPTVQSKKTQAKQKINLDGEKIRNGLAQLVLTVVALLRELMEKQAIRRIEAGKLTDEQVENLGNTFMKLKDEIEKLKDYFEFEDEDLNLDLGPIIAREDETTTDKASAVELLDRLLGKGVVVKGDIVISVADVDLLSLNLGLILASIDKARELYSSATTSELEEEVKKLAQESKRIRKVSEK